MAEVQVGVVTQAASAEDALKANNEAMERLMGALTARSIAEKDVQTSGFSIVPQYKYEPQGRHDPKIVGYQVSNQVHVRVRQLAALGPLLDAVVGKGANQVGGIHFAVAEPAPYLDDARRKAVADARRKAELYAGAAGVELGRVLLLDEAPHGPRPVGAQPMARAAGPAVPVAAGELEFHAGVTITYALK